MVDASKESAPNFFAVNGRDTEEVICATHSGDQSPNPLKFDALQQRRSGATDQLCLVMGKRAATKPLPTRKKRQRTDGPPPATLD